MIKDKYPRVGFLSLRKQSYPDFSSINQFCSLGGESKKMVVFEAKTPI
jgi:hypothetical protein